MTQRTHPATLTPRPPRRAAALCLAALAAVAGCGKQEPPQAPPGTPSAGTTTLPSAVLPSPATLPATQPVSNATPADDLPDPRPQISQVMVDNRFYLFPRAMLRLSTPDGNLNARLYTDDPPTVLANDQDTNAYDLDMALPDVSDPADVAKGVWKYEASTDGADRADTPYGIFLNTAGRTLQPRKVEVHFEGAPPHVKVFLAGQFWSYDTAADAAPGQAPKTVNVAAVLQATVPEKKK